MHARTATAGRSENDVRPLTAEVVVDVANRVVELHGFDALTMRRLSDELGVAVTSIYWHVGNRHTALQVLPDGALRLRDDHVLADMLEGLGAAIERKRAPFSPEPGAYAAAPAHAHPHHPAGHSHDRGR